MPVTTKLYFAVIYFLCSFQRKGSSRGLSNLNWKELIQGVIKKTLETRI